MKVSKVFEFTVYTTLELEAILIHILRKKPLSDTTKKQIAKKLVQWVSYLDLKTLNNLLYNPANSIHALHNTTKIKHSPTNHHIYISSVVAYIKYITKKDELLNKWKEIERKNAEPLAEHYDKNEPTVLQSNKVISLAELHKIRESLEEGTIERLLIAFYTLMEPLRADYYATKLIRPGALGELKDLSDNYIILHDMGAQLIVNNFKTKRKYEKIENTLPSAIIDELNASLKKCPRDYLFVMEDKKTPFTRKLFSNWACRALSRIIGKKMTLTVLRHIYISDKIQARTPASELIDISKKMGHSRGMQRVYEWQQPISS